MNPPVVERKCASCQGTNLQYGHFGSAPQTFVPDGEFMWLGYRTKLSVCLDCGYVGCYISEKDVQDIRKNHQAR